MLRAVTPERLSAFSDAVFAVLITVLVLELRPPELPTYKALLSLWPTGLSYAVSYGFIAIVWANHHHLMRYATTATPRLMVQCRAPVFRVAAADLHRLDGRERAGSPASVLLCSGLLPRERDLHVSDLGADRPPSRQRRSAEGAQDDARPIDRDPVSVRSGRDRRAEISSRWIGDVCFLLGCVFEAGGSGSGVSQYRGHLRGSARTARHRSIALQKRSMTRSRRSVGRCG